MSQRLTPHQRRTLAIVIAAPGQAPTPVKVDRSFGLPNALYVATVALYLAFIGLMGTVFMNPELAIPVVVFAGFVLMAFGLAGCWTTMRPRADSVTPTWSQFAARGVDTLTGRLDASEAAIQVLMLPALILCWGVAIAVIVAFT